MIDCFATSTELSAGKLSTNHSGRILLTSAGSVQGSKDEAKVIVL